MNFDSLFESNSYDELAAQVAGMETPEDPLTTTAEDDQDGLWED